MERSELDGAIVQWHFTCVEPANNHNKFWSIGLLQNGDLYVEYGRIGNAAQSKHHSIGNGTIAFRKMDSLIRQNKQRAIVRPKVHNRLHQNQSSLLKGKQMRDRSLYLGTEGAIA